MFNIRTSLYSQLAHCRVEGMSCDNTFRVQGYNFIMDVFSGGCIGVKGLSIVNIFSNLYC